MTFWDFADRHYFALSVVMILVALFVCEAVASFAKRGKP